MRMNGKEVVNVSPSNAMRLVHPMHTVLVTCMGKDGKPNIITLAWAMPTSISPPLVAVSIAPRRYSHSLIEETKEFVVNIPTINILDATFYCGRVSGRDHDKFKEAGLTPLPARKVKPPIIKECIAHLECKLYGKFPTGDHTIFVGEIVEAYANKECYSEMGYNLEKAKMVFHLGGNEFATLEPKIFTPKI
jgi:flavin reductase (DIM6/NTAB) family NADH-FMN oxidoreductase RutF